MTVYRHFLIEFGHFMVYIDGVLLLGLGMIVTVREKVMIVFPSVY